MKFFNEQLTKPSFYVVIALMLLSIFQTWNVLTLERDADALLESYVTKTQEVRKMDASFQSLTEAIREQDLVMETQRSELNALKVEAIDQATRKASLVREIASLRSQIQLLKETAQPLSGRSVYQQESQRAKKKVFWREQRPSLGSPVGRVQ